MNTYIHYACLQHLAHEYKYIEICHVYLYTRAYIVCQMKRVETVTEVNFLTIIQNMPRNAKIKGGIHRADMLVKITDGALVYC